MIAVLVIVVAAVIVYQQTIPVTRVIRSRLSELVIVHPGIAGYKPLATTAKQIPGSSYPFAAVTAAAKSDPDHTGGYLREWKSTSSKYKLSDILAVWVPTDSAARATLKQAVAQYVGRSTYASDGYTYSSSLATTVPGSVGASYQGKATKTTPAGFLAVTAFRQGLVVVVVDTLGTNATETRADTVNLVRSQNAHLTSTAPGFSLTRTTRPPLATALFAVATVAAAVTAVLMLGFGARLRRRRRLRRAARARYEIEIKGQRIVKHYRPPTR
jgi:hypothetical protein